MAKPNDPDDEPIDTTAEETDSVDARRRAGRGGRVRRPGSLVRIAGFVLMGLGVLLAALSGPAVFDPSGTRCTLARTLIDDANDDDEKFNDVSIDGDDADDVECTQAIRLAQRIRTDEDDADELEELPSDTAVRTQGTISSIIGIGQAISGFVVGRTRHRRARTFAVSFAALGLVFPLLGLISLAAMAFVIYAADVQSRRQGALGRVTGLRWPAPSPCS